MDLQVIPSVHPFKSDDEVAEEEVTEVAEEEEEEEITDLAPLGSFTLVASAAHIQ